MLKHASLFSGIGGFDLAAEWAGWENIFHCEWNPFGQKVLAHHFPNSKSYNDITKTDFTVHSGQIDVLTGGFPCQPYSQAGKRLGKADERHLFPEMLRAIQEIKPKWVIGENVRGLVNWNGGLVFDEVCADLESKGYEVQPFLIPAASVNAPHQRQRIWFIAYSNSNGNRNIKRPNSKENGISEVDRQTICSRQSFGTNTNNATNSNLFRCEGEREQRSIDKKGQKRKKRFRELGDIEFGRWKEFPTKPALCGRDDGLPRELDSITFSKWRGESIKAYRNAIVPQVAYEIFKAINEFELLVNK
jgi:DNA (cytosine-5)-methyltransferase 1